MVTTTEHATELPAGDDIPEARFTRLRRYNLFMGCPQARTATVVLRPPNDTERVRGSLTGAVITGLGPFDGSLGMTRLVDAVRCGEVKEVDQSLARSMTLRRRRTSLGDADG